LHRCELASVRVSRTVADSESLPESFDQVQLGENALRAVRVGLAVPGDQEPWNRGRRLFVRLSSRRFAAPRISSTEADLRQQFDLAKQVEAERVRLSSALNQARGLRERITALRARAEGTARGALDEFVRGLDRAAGPPIGSEEDFDESEAESTNLRRLSSGMARFQRAVESADVAPTPDALAGFERRRAEVSRELSHWKGFLDTELPALNRALEAAGLPRQECCN
jgi:hypothetical protein